NHRVGSKEIPASYRRLEQVHPGPCLDSYVPCRLEASRLVLDTPLRPRSRIQRRVTGAGEVAGACTPSGPKPRWAVPNLRRSPGAGLRTLSSLRCPPRQPTLTQDPEGVLPRHKQGEEAIDAPLLGRTSEGRARRHTDGL